MAVIVGSDKSRKKHWINMTLLVTAALVAMVAAGAGLRWLQTRNDPGPTPKLPDVVAELQDMRTQGHSFSFDQKIEEALADPSIDDDTRYMLYLQQGHAFVDRDQMDEAIEVYKKAGNIKQTLEVTELLADTYRDSGNKEKAIEYYKKAIPLVPQDNPRRESIKRSFESWIKELEAGGAAES